MPRDNYANTYQTTLNDSGGISSGDTSMIVASDTGSPDVNFRVRIDSELILVTAKSGTTFTITRGVEGTSAASHADGATVTHVLTAASLQLVVPVLRGWAIRHASNQALSTSGEADLVFDTDVIDTDAYHFTSAANLSGTVSKTASSGAVTGSSTSFTTELTVGQVIMIPGTANEYFRVTTITDNTNIVVAPNAQNNASGQVAVRKSCAVVIPPGLGGYYDLAHTAQTSAATTAYLALRKFTSSTADELILVTDISGVTTGVSHRRWSGSVQHVLLSAGDIVFVRGIAAASCNLEGGATRTSSFSGRLVGTT